MSLVLKNVEVDGRICDVRIERGLVAEIGAGLRGGEVFDTRRGALIPGLHDRHVHLLAMAARRASVELGAATSIADLARILREASNRLGPASPTSTAPLAQLSARGSEQAPPWIRAVGYHESAGELNRWVLDRMTGDCPTRVQHRSGALWILNSAALRTIRLDDSTDVERDEKGEPNGRLWRYDARLHEQLPREMPDIASLGGLLASHGITAVTDATPDLDAEAARHLAPLPQRLTLLGAGSVHSPRKIMLRDHDLPDFEILRSMVLAARAENRCVAVHCVTRLSLLLTLAVLDEVGRWPGDRIEHAAVVPEPALLHGLTVVTQPGFIAVRGDDYYRDVDPDDLAHLYPFASLVAAGIRVHASSDAPFGPLDPWQVIAAARDRRTPSGRVLGREERVGADVTLSSYLHAPKITVGMPADLCLLHTPLAEALATPDTASIRAVWIGGELVFGAL